MDEIFKLKIFIDIHCIIRREQNEKTADGNQNESIVQWMAPTCLYALPTTSGHAPNETTDGVWGT